MSEKRLAIILLITLTLYGLIAIVGIWTESETIDKVGATLLLAGFMMSGLFWVYLVLNRTKNKP